MQEIKLCGSILDKYFDVNTMSIHIKEWLAVMKKSWAPWNRKPTKTEEILTKDQLSDLIDMIFNEVENRDDSFLEIDRSMSKVIQLWIYRIVITYPPLSDGLEMTVVRPVKKLSIEDYNLDEEVVDLLRNTSRGILVAWAPGSGKTTFAQALVELYNWDENVIKTVESPRDLMVPDEVVQYSFSHWTHEEIRDILLLSRPDFTIYDEVRNKPDFELYKDLRLTGIGLVWVIHATEPVHSIQRFIGTIEMGIIPQVLDTVVFIKDGQIWEILQLKLVVKVPHGMMSEDLARPVIVISSFFDKRDVYEIYTFWEQVVVVPTDAVDTKDWGTLNSVEKYAKESLDMELEEILGHDFVSKITWQNSIKIYVPENKKWALIWKGGKNIIALEKELGFRIDVLTTDELPISDIKTNIIKKGQKLIVKLEWDYPSKHFIVCVAGDIYNMNTDERSQLTISSKALITLINKRWLLLVNPDDI